MHSSITASSLVLALCLVPAVLGEQRSFVRRANKAHKAAASASSSGSASDAQYTTINGKQYPTDLSPNAPAPIVTTNWWLDEVQKNDTTKHSFAYDSLPKSSEDGQKGTNQCTKGQNQGSMCQTVLVNGADDFCLWAPPDKDTAIADSEEYEVAWCTKDHGARLIPQGTLSSVHFVKTDKYVQVTGTGDFTKINIKAGDQGGELDPHGATGNGNPIGGLVYTTAFSNGKKHDQILEWMSEISATDFCFRGCKGTDADAQMQCTHIYDEMGCGFIMPANYTENIFEECSGEAAPPPGIIGTWTFTQGDPVTPSPRPAPSSSDCSNIASPTGPSFTGPAASPSASSSAAAGAATGAAAAAGKAASTLPSLGQKAAATGSSSGAQGQQNANSRSTVTSGAYTTAVSLITVAGVVMVSTGAFVLL